MISSKKTGFCCFFHRLALDSSIFNDLFLGFIDKGLDVIITADGPMFLNGTSFPADLENLRAIIIEKTGIRRDIPVSIVADGDMRHAMVVMSIDTVSQLGFRRLTISTQRPAAGD